ncbi:PAS domain S-box protein [Methanospirillum sp. J.3.6.1-F.2.7.3]|uniref:histidine kinase n=1 Tax=Methanospirillum purgamenti TaxID=2834276 RepID=A0A8E7EIM6_9EURY|nr:MULTISPECIES: PAS domain S-box protein [Methanospirillum]QVV87691.1 PAS domain S-box protein [Methanospirillum sp. J.3.6.1-F.2.7.3]
MVLEDGALMPDYTIIDNTCDLTNSQPKISVLYVDDESNLLELGKLFLEDTGEFLVDILNSAEEALSSSNLRFYDAIISDYQMPDMDGIEFLKEVRKQIGDTPFIIFTGKGREDVVIEAINNGADFYLQKGGEARSQYAELSHKIKQAVGKKRAERSLRDSKKQLSDIIEFLPDATFAINKSGLVIAWNRAIEEMTGISSAQIMGKGNYEYALPFYGHRRPLLLDLIQNPDNTITSYYSNINRIGNAITAEAVLSFPKGNDVYTLIKACPLYNQSGEITGAIESIRDITQAKKTGLSLIESEIKFRNLVEYSRDSILIVDFFGIIQFLNPTGLSMVDEDNLDQIIGKKYLRNYIHPDFLEMVIKDMNLIAQGNEGYTLQYKLVTGKNREIWVEGHGRKIPHQHSEAILISLREITERKLAEEKLRESEEKFRSFAELQPQMVFETDIHLTLTYINQHGRSESQTPQNIIKEGISALDFIHPSYHTKVKDNIQKLIDGIPYELEEYLAIRKDGSTFPINIYSSPIYRNGTVTGIRGVIIDISERKRFETELKESEEKFRALVEQSHDGTIIVDFSGNVLFANPRIGIIIGHTNVQNLVHNSNIFSFILPEFHEQIKHDMNEVKSGHEGYAVLYQVQTVDNRKIWIECTGKKISYSGFPAILLSIHDITERKIAEDALRDSEEKMGTIFRNNPVALTVVSAADGVFADVNEAFLKMTGYEKSSVIGKTSEELGIFSDNNQYRNLLSLLQNQKPVSGLEIICQKASGEKNICRFSSGFIMMGNKPHILSSIEDITMQKSLQSAFEALIRSMVGTIGINSLKTITENIHSWLNADCTMIGEILEDKKTVKVLSMILDGKEIYDYSYTLVGTPCENVAEKGFCVYTDDVEKIFPNSPDLQEFNIRGYIGTPLRNSDGEVVGILCALFRQPIEPSIAIQKILEIIAVKAAAEIERAQIEKTLLKSQRDLEEAMDLANLANWEYDVARDMFTFNDRFYSLYGTTAEREGGYHMSSQTYARKFSLPGDSHLVAKEVERDIQATDPNFLSHVEHRIIRGDGEVRHISVRIRITKDNLGRTTKTHGVNQDITERKRAEEVIRKANRQLSLLTGITRHDILNKISVMYTLLELGQLECKDPELSGYLQSTISTIEEIQSLIEFTRVYEELGSQEPQWVDLQSVISKLHIPDSIHFIKDIADISIFADLMIQKVFFTLLDNSIRHGQKVTEIRIFTKEIKGGIVVIWEDNGLGIAYDEKEEIFGKGFGKNTGFGLFLAQEILNLTDICIKETGIPGDGARFEIFILPDGWKKS